MNGESVWQTLGLAPTADRDQIRRAYSAKLKATNPEDDAEGFKALRVAYEQALRFVGRLPVQQIEIDDPDPTDLNDHNEFGHEIAHRSMEFGVEVPQERAQPTSELHRHYAQLSEAFLAPAINLDAAQRAIREILGSDELDHVTARLDCELALAGLLMRQLPRSEDLLLQVAIHFRWYELENRVGAPALLVNASRCARDITHLQTMRKAGHPYSNAFKALTSTPSTALLRLRILTSDLDSSVRKLLHEFEYERTYGANTFDSEALQWWREYLSKPRVSKLMLWSSILLPVFVAMAQAVAEGPTNALQSASMMLLIMAGLTVGKLYVLDWGRKFAKRQLAYISEPALLAPFPLATMFCAIASVYDDKVLAVSAVLAALCAAFAWFTRAELQVKDATNAWASIAYLNIPAAVWLGMISFEQGAGFALVCTLMLLTHVFTHTRLVAYWFKKFSAAQRSRIIAGLLIVGLFVVGAWLETEAPVKPMIAVSLCLVLLQRVAVSSLSETQYKIRYYAMYAVMLVAFAALDLSQRDAEISIVASVFFLFGAIVGLSMALWSAIVNAHR